MGGYLHTRMEATEGFNAHASCIFKAPAWYSCTRKLNPNVRLRMAPVSPFSLSLSLALALPIFLSGSRTAFSFLRPFGFVARSSLIENQNSGELIGEGIRRDRDRSLGTCWIHAHVHARKYNYQNVT